KKAEAKKALDTSKDQYDALKDLAGQKESLAESLAEANKTLSETDSQIQTGTNEDGTPIMGVNPAYEKAQQAVSEANTKYEAAVKAEKELNNAKSKQVEAQKLYEDIKAYEEEFLQLREESGLNKAESDLEKATVEATSEALGNAAKSHERKELDEATKILKEAQHKADGQYEEVIFAMMSANEITRPYAAALSQAKSQLKETIGREKKNIQYDMAARELIELLNDEQFEVNIVYEKVNAPNPPSGGGGHDTVTPKPPTIIKDDETPLAEGPAEQPNVPNMPEAPNQVIMDEKVPLAQLPKTGGVGTLGFLGLGVILATLGWTRKRKED
ncbi:MAG: LPXTG cell wall anchor domain-containing protein, partial [Anaerovorax sp.]